ncbi:uncharacterized protein KZ484_025240 [Pholidichthys leucotaenia]
MADNSAESYSINLRSAPRKPVCMGCVVSAMDQDPEDRVRPSKPLWGDHEVQTKGQKSEQHTGPGPGSSCVSMRSDRSKDFPLHFKRDHEVQTKGQRSEQHTGPGPGLGPGPSCVSMRSDRSKDFPLHFKRDHEVQTKGQRSEQHTGPGPGPGLGPGPSCVSMRSDRSKDFPLHFKRDHDDPAQRFELSEMSLLVT